MARWRSRNKLRKNGCIYASLALFVIAWLPLIFVYIGSFFGLDAGNAVGPGVLAWGLSPVAILALIIAIMIRVYGLIKRK